MLNRSFFKLQKSFLTSAPTKQYKTELSKTVTRLDYLNLDKQTGNRNTFRGPLNAAILDWSGTTADAHVLAPAVVFVDVFEKHGVPISMEEARLPMGLRKDLHIAKILEIPEVKQRWIDIKNEQPNEETVKTLFADFVPMQIACLPRYTTLLPGVADVVDTMKSKYNLKLGSTTGFTRSMVEILLEDASKQGYIPDSSVAGDDVINNLGFRPAPFMIYQNLLNLGIWPIESVLKVDDTVSGVGEGLNAGCWSVGVYGWSNYTNINSLEHWENLSSNEKIERQEFSKNKLIKESGAHYVIKDLNDIEIVIQDINERLKYGQTPMNNNILTIQN